MSKYAFYLVHSLSWVFWSKQQNNHFMSTKVAFNDFGSHHLLQFINLVCSWSGLSRRQFLIKSIYCWIYCSDRYFKSKSLWAYKNYFFRNYFSGIPKFSFFSGSSSTRRKRRRTRGARSLTRPPRRWEEPSASRPWRPLWRPLLNSSSRFTSRTRGSKRIQVGVSWIHGANVTNKFYAEIKQSDWLFQVQCDQKKIAKCL